MNTFFCVSDLVQNQSEKMSAPVVKAAAVMFQTRLLVPDLTAVQQTGWAAFQQWHGMSGSAPPFPPVRASVPGL